MALTVVAARLDDIADSLVAHAVGTFNGAFDGVAVALLTDSAPITEDTVWTDLTEAAFTGYARSSAVVWLVSHRNPDGSYSALGDGKQWIMTDAVTPQTITGVALVIGAGGSTVLVAAERFDTPVPLTRADQQITYVPEVGPPAGSYGHGTVII